MNILQTQWWTLAVPPEWWAESDAESILVGDHDGVGSIEISTLFKEEGEFTSGDVLEIARDEAEQPLDWQVVELGDLRGVTAGYVHEGSAIREWYVFGGAMLLFITYSCDEETLGLDDAAVEEILATLMVVPG